jgi:predicted nucleic acid-binding protein
MSFAALITANVLQNGLSRNEDSSRYYTDLLLRLSSQPVRWYISELDWHLAFTMWRIYNLGGDRAWQEAFNAMAQIITRCPVNESILENSGFPGINFYDAIRLACAIDASVDAIVTWEPNQFTANARDRNNVWQHGYFDRTFEARLADDDSPYVHNIRVFSASAFLLELFDAGNFSETVEESRTSCTFQLEHLTLQIADEHHATVVVCSSQGAIQEMATGLTPCDALYKAIDRCVDQCTLLPSRHLVHYTVPGTIGGADSPIEVRINVECDRRLFEASASHPNVIRAFGDAYINAINDICNRLNFG